MTRTLILAALGAALQTQAAVFTAHLSSPSYPDAWATITADIGIDDYNIPFTAEWETPFAPNAVFMQSNGSSYYWFDVETSPETWTIPRYFSQSQSFEGHWVTLVEMSTGEQLIGTFYADAPPPDEPPPEPEIPEPGAYAGLFALGLVGFATYRRLKLKG